MATSTAATIALLRQRLQAAQQTDVTYRLSEQNCVEVVRRLVEAGLLAVIYTLDGKEYITPEKLDKELLQELQAHGGRVELVELQRALNVDLAFVEESARRLLRRHLGLTLLTGELMNDAYFSSVADEINELLQDTGQLYMGDLCQRFNLPVEYLNQLVDSRLGKSIMGQRDITTASLYTDAYLRRQRAILRGALTACTRSTVLRSLAQHHPTQERLIHSTVEELVASGAVMGKVRGVRDGASYVPDVFQRLQSQSAIAFFHQSGYIEFDALRKLEVDDPKAFMRKTFPNLHIVLVNLFLKPSTVDQVDANIDEALASTGWINIAAFVPPPLLDDDIDLLLTLCPSLKNRPTDVPTSKTLPVEDAIVHLPEHLLCTGAFLKSSFAVLEPVVKEAAKKAMIASGPPLPNANETETQVSASTATTSTSTRKGKVAANDFEDEDDWSTDSQARNRKGKKGKNATAKTVVKATTAVVPAKSAQKLPESEMHVVLQRLAPDADSDLISGIIDRLRPQLIQLYEDQLEQFRSPAVLSGATRKKAQEATRDQVDELRQNMILFQRGAKLFEDTQTVSQLEKYLLKTLGQSLVDVVLVDLVRMNNLIPMDTEMEPEVLQRQIVDKRDEYAAQLPPADAKAVRALLTSIGMAKTLDEFLAVLDQTAPNLGLYWKKSDKKKERQIIFKQRQALLAQLRGTLDPSLVLHLVGLLLFQQVTKNMLHAPGKMVPQLVSFLGMNGQLPDETMQALMAMQTLVIKSLSSGKGDPAVQEQLTTQADTVRRLALQPSSADDDTAA